MKHFKPLVALVFLTGLLGLIFFYHQKFLKKSRNQTTPPPTLPSCIKQPLPDGMAIRINNISIPQLLINQDYSIQLQADESFLSPSKPLITCNTVTGTLIHKGVAAGIFKAPQVIINQDQKYLTIPATIKLLFSEITMHGNDVYYDMTQETITIKKNITGKHAQFSLQAGTASIDIKNQSIMLDDGVCTEFFRNPLSTRQKNVLK